MAICLICEVLTSSPMVPFRQLFSFDEAFDEVLMETDGFSVISDVAPVVEGHCLVVANSHVESMARLGPAVRRELTELIGVVEDILSAHYGPCCLFEHGSGTRPGDIACIEHAHLHVVPYDGDLRTVSRYRDSFVEVSGWEGLDAVSGDIGYLFTRSSMRRYWLSVRQQVERQHWRRVLSTALEIDFPDWRLMNSTDTGRAMARRRIARLRGIFLSA